MKCVGQGYDGSNNMMGEKAGVAVLVKIKCPLSTINWYLCHMSSLPCEAAHNNLPFMNDFQSQKFENLNLIKKSSQRECSSQEHKNVVIGDKINEDPSKVGENYIVEPHQDDREL